MQTIRVLITGPAGSGKSTLAARIAAMLLDNGRDVDVMDYAHPLKNDIGREMSLDDIEGLVWPAGPAKNRFEITVAETSAEQSTTRIIRTEK